MHRFLIIEEALRNHDGHWYEYNRATKSALLEFEPTMQIDMLGHKSMEPNIAAELSAIPHFRFTVWDHIYNQPQAWRRYLGILQHNRRLYKDLKNYLITHEKYDFVFAPTVVLHHLLGYHAIASRYGGSHFEQLILLIRNNIATYDEQGTRKFRSTARFWRLAIQRFSSLIESRRVRFLTDSERLADEYEELTGIRFGVVPHPCVVNSPTVSLATANSHPNQGPARFFLPGPSRYEKGTDRLLASVKALEGRLAQPIEITLQWDVPFTTPEGRLVCPEDANSKDPNIKFRIHRSPLSSSEYLDELTRADFIILPYRRDTYFARISGVAVEAMLLGKPLLFTGDTWVDTIASQFSCGLRMEDSSEGVKVAIIQALEQTTDLNASATIARASAAQFFCVSTFCKALCDFDVS